MVAGLFGMFFLGALYLQRVLGYDPVEIGLAFLPASIGIGAFSFRLSPRLVIRFGARPVLLPGLRSIAAGLALLRPGAGRRQLRHRRPAGDARCSASAPASRSRR